MAQTTKAHAEEALVAVCEEISSEYLSRLQTEITSYNTAYNKIIAAGADVNSSSVWTDNGYDLTDKKDLKSYLEKTVVKDLNKRQAPLTWQWSSKVTEFEDGTNRPYNKHYGLIVYLKPKSGETGNTYQAVIGPISLGKTGSAKYLTGITNPGDSEGGTVQSKTETNTNTPASQKETAKTTKTDQDIASFKEPIFTNDTDKKANQEQAKLHPERTVNGIYYVDDDTLAKAQAWKAAQEKNDANSGSIKGATEASKLVAAMKAVNSTLYGDQNAEVVKQLQGSVGSLDLNSVLGDAISVRNRQKLLNFQKFKYDYKAPNSGKPPANKDPFPVDQKIEELESHQPKVKIYAITTHIHDQPSAVALIQQFDATEKRLVRLENNLATLTRYLYRLGSRVMINCVYYGGQTSFEKEHIDNIILF